MKFEAVIYPQPRSRDSIKSMLDRISEECEICLSVNFTTIQYGVKYSPDGPNSTKIVDVVMASQVAFLEVANCAAYLLHYLPELKPRIFVVNTDRENEPWVFCSLILLMDQDTLPATEELTEFVKYFQKAQEKLGKQIKLFRRTTAKPYANLELIEDPSSIVTQPGDIVHVAGATFSGKIPGINLKALEADSAILQVEEDVPLNPA